MALDKNVRLWHITAMKLHEYMTLTKKTDTELSVRLGKHRATVTKYRLGKLTPPIETIAELDRETNGAVSFRDFLSPNVAA